VPQKFRELSSIDQFRVCRFLTRGDAPDDPELAAVTLETADYLRSQSRVKAEVFRWTPIVLALILAVSAVPNAMEGQVGMLFFLLFLVICAVANLMLNPWTRPTSVVRSAEASRRILASSGRDRPAKNSNLTA
jgi:hypothetical protein